MLTIRTKISASLDHFKGSPWFSAIRIFSTWQTLQESIREAVEAKRYQQIPELLNDSKESIRNPNPFSFLSNYSQHHITQTIDEILQSFMPLRPRSRPQPVYSYLLSYTLQSRNPLPLALAILQRTLRSGCIPAPQIRLLLSNAWLEKRQQSQSISDIFFEMQSIGYHPDSGTCNYLISSLCAVDQLTEAAKVLKCMSRVGCIPNLESYGTLIGAMCVARRTRDAAEKMKEMVEEYGLTPRQEMVVKVVRTMRADKEMSKAFEMIEFLEKTGFCLGFECYELALEGCLQFREFVLAGKVATWMIRQGFIPYIRARQKVVEGLVSVGEEEFASALRQKFAELNS